MPPAPCGCQERIRVIPRLKLPTFEISRLMLFLLRILEREDDPGYAKFYHGLSNTSS
jgi:hypothetical protein